MALRSGNSKKMSASISIGVPDPLRKELRKDDGLDSSRNSRKTKQDKSAQTTKQSSKMTTASVFSIPRWKGRSKKDSSDNAMPEADTNASTFETNYDTSVVMPKIRRGNLHGNLYGEQRNDQRGEAKYKLPKADVTVEVDDGAFVEETVVANKQPITMRLHQRILINVLLLIPLIFAILAFGLRQQDLTAQPERVSQVTVRGDILDRNGNILAQGPAENRVYPHRQIAAPLIGFSGEQQIAGNHGLEGLEKTLDSYLQAGLVQDIFWLLLAILNTIQTSKNATAQMLKITVCSYNKSTLVQSLNQSYLQLY